MKNKLTQEQRFAASLIVADIAARPSFGVALRWVKRGSGAKKSNQGYPTSVGAMCFNLQHTWGAVVDRQTMAIALETAGFKIAARSFGPGLHPELATNIRRSSVSPAPWRTERPRPERWLWAKDAAPVPGAENLYRNLLP